MLTLLMSIVIPASFVLIFRFMNVPRKSPIFGVYQQPNKYYCAKFLYMYVFLRLRQLKNYLQQLLDVELGKSSDGTVHVQNVDIELEDKYCLNDFPQAVDAVYYNGMSKKGEALICGLARRPKNICDAYLYLKVDGEELLLSPKLPDTYLLQNTSEEGEYSVQGISVVNFIPMRTWEITYKGEMKPRTDTDKRVKVELELTWSASFAPFRYNTHISPRSVAKDFAREKWSVDYFSVFKKLQQTHYEQMGFIEGTVTIDGKKRELTMPCVRNHTSGPYLEWRNFHRYILHFIYLENGDCMTVGVISQPAILSHLTIGYICRESDQTRSVYAVDECDLQLYQHGENQKLSTDYGFVFEAGNELYAVQVQVNDEETFYIGKDREAKIYERWCSVEVNGVKGWACVEWHYNNVAS